VLGIFENLHLEAITCVKWADDRTIVTTSRDTVVCIWRIVQSRSYELKLMKCLRGHRETVNTVAISVAYSIIVSGSEDKSCIIWDLNRLEYVRQLGKHEDGVRVVAINDATGDIATCSGPVLRLWTVNGDLILQKYTTQIGDPILDCVFYAGRTGEWVPREIVFTSHRRGTIKVWEKAVIDAEYQRYSHQSQSGGGGGSMSSLQLSLDNMLLSTSSSFPAGIATIVEEDSELKEQEELLSPAQIESPTSFKPGHAADSSVSTSGAGTTLLGNGDDMFGSRTRQSSQATHVAKYRMAKWALRLRQSYTFEDRLRMDGGTPPNIVSLYVSR
jgi:WD40 repeat protein